MLSFTPSFILADVAPPPGYTSNFDYCVKIVNLEKYPNYLVFINISSANLSLPTSGYLLVKPNQCLPLAGYRPIAKIAAIAKNRVNSTDLKQTDSQTILQNKNLEKSLISANIDIPRPSTLPIIYEGQKVEESIQIQSLDPNNLALSTIAKSPPQIFNWIFLPPLGLAILGWVCWKQRNQKVKN
ncbi:MAG: hypothetical protein KME17_18770 [Cyanosarcina radialis HA8281-LM2]|jgi:hypothetical protein|nr:hypothetical protein [Cyanosarcina radialis HA8281-LM2]